IRAHETVHAALGFLAQRDPAGPWTVAAVDADGSAAKAGLQAGDEIVRWNNGDVPRRPERWTTQQKPGDVLHLRVRRNGKEETLDVRLGEVRQRFWQVTEVASADDRARRLREGLLRGTTEPVTANRR